MWVGYLSSKGLGVVPPLVPTVLIFQKICVLMPAAGYRGGGGGGFQGESVSEGWVGAWRKMGGKKRGEQGEEKR